MGMFCVNRDVSRKNLEIFNEFKFYLINTFTLENVNKNY